MQGAHEGLAAYQRTLLVAWGRKVLMMPAAWWPRRSRRFSTGVVTESGKSCAGTLSL